MDNNLSIYIKEHPIKFIILVLLYTLGASSFANIKIFQDTRTSQLIIFNILKGITLIFPIYLIKFINKTNKDIKINFFSIVCVALFFITCINNFPVVSIINNNSKFVFDVDFILYVIACLEIAIFEEIIFRYLIFNVMFYNLKFKNYFSLIFFNSLIFSLCHLANAFSLNPLLLLMQLGYSFLIGALCAFSYVITKKVFIPILLHFIYDVGGLLTNYNYIIGNIWDKQTIFFTIILSVLVLIYALIVYFKFYNRKFYENSSTESEKC